MSTSTEDPRVEHLQDLLLPPETARSAQPTAQQDPAAAGRWRRRYRPDLVVLNLWVVFLGGWVIAAPWALHYPTSGDARLNDWVCGGAVVILALIGGLGWRQKYLSWVNGLVGLIGVWLGVAIIAIDRATAAIWSDFLFGFLIFLSSSVLLGVADPTRARFAREAPGTSA